MQQLLPNNCSKRYAQDRIKRSTAIKLIEINEDNFKVYGSTGKIYTITKTEPDLQCNCIDYKKNKRYCKHIYFILLNVYKSTNRLEEPLQPRNEECSICFEQLDKPIVCKTCKHGFHNLCIHEMEKVSKKSNCPMCRTDFFNINDFLEQVQQL